MDIHSKFQQELQQGERILWTGQPDPNIFFTKGDLFLIPFSLLWGGGMMFAVLPGLFTGNQLDFPFGFFPLIFVFVGAYITVGRFIFKYLRKKKTYYAVTNHRALMLTELFGRNLQAINIKTVSAVNKSSNSQGTGSIVFGELSQQASMYSNMGMDLFSGNVPAFFDIHNVDHVYTTLGRKND